MKFGNELKLFIRSLVTINYTFFFGALHFIDQQKYEIRERAEAVYKKLGNNKLQELILTRPENYNGSYGMIDPEDCKKLYCLERWYSWQY
jgi:hypothetical protein